MIKTIFMILFCVHLTGDFYVQTQKMADRKQRSFLWTIYHCLIYAAFSCVLFLLFLPGMKAGYILAFVFGHALIDTAKYAICFILQKKPHFLSTPAEKRNVFLIDQAAHLVLILGITYWMRSADIAELYGQWAGELFDVFGMPETVFLQWASVLLMIHKPVNLFIANILSGYRPSDKEEPISAKKSSDREDRNAGRMIGTLERIIMTVFISIGQYSAVGLVLTAKSIARYDRISRDQVFAEYYLLGTLLSTICAVAAVLLFF